MKAVCFIILCFGALTFVVGCIWLLLVFATLAYDEIEEFLERKRK